MDVKDSVFAKDWDPVLANSLTVSSGDVKEIRTRLMANNEIRMKIFDQNGLLIQATLDWDEAELLAEDLVSLVRNGQFRGKLK